MRDISGTDEPRRARAADTGRPLVRLRDVHRAFTDGTRRHEVLRGLDLDIAAGENVALLGPSGSGKSTLLNVIAGIDAVDAGSVEIAGRTLGGMTERERTLLRRRRIGFVFQFFNLVPTLTALENVILPLELTSGRGARADRHRMRSESLSLLERVGLGDRGASFPEELSGGEQQRVAIARALVHGPDLLLADEPTGNLDSVTGERVLHVLTTLAAERGTTMLIATHAPDVVARASRVVTLHDGMIDDVVARGA